MRLLVTLFFCCTPVFGFSGCSEAVQSRDTSKRAQALSALESIRKSCDTPHVAKELNSYFIPAYDGAIAHLNSSSEAELRIPYIVSASMGEHNDDTTFFKMTWIESNTVSVVRKVLFLDAERNEISKPLEFTSNDSDYLKSWTVKTEVAKREKLGEEKIALDRGTMLLEKGVRDTIHYLQFVYVDERSGELKKTNPAEILDTISVIGGERDKGSNEIKGQTR